MKNNLANMMCLDVYLSSLSKEEYKNIRHRIKPIKTESKSPLLSWDVFMEGYHNNMLKVKKEQDFKEVLSFAKKFDWKNDLNLAFSENDYQALIITDKYQTIIWVNDGFTTMTGYSRKFAVNKTPKFLQGEKTSLRTKNRIKAKLAEDRPFKAIITNYKKDKTTYTCEVKIIPLYSQDTTHYLAFERKLA